MPTRKQAAFLISKLFAEKFFASFAHWSATENGLQTDD